MSILGGFSYGSNIHSNSVYSAILQAGSKQAPANQQTIAHARCVRTLKRNAHDRFPAARKLYPYTRLLYRRMSFRKSAVLIVPSHRRSHFEKAPCGNNQLHLSCFRGGEANAYPRPTRAAGN